MCAAECGRVFVLVLNLALLLVFPIAFPIAFLMATANESSVPVFDTRKYARKLMRGGVSEQHADAHASALHDALGGVATKADIAVLQADIDALRVEVASVVREMQALRQEMQALRQEMQALRQLMVMGIMVGFGWMTLMIGLMTIVFKFL